MPANKKEHLRYRYGICLNDSCSKCKSKEVQQIAARKDLICEECGKPLRECPPPRSFWDKHGKKVIIAACALLALIILVPIARRNWSTDSQKTPGEDGQTEVTGGNGGETPDPTNQEGPDTLQTPPGGPGETKDPKGEDNVNDSSNVERQTPPQTPPKPQPKPQPKISVPFGTYSGPADGMNGTITVTRHYSLDLRDAAHSTIELQPGDVITQTQFRNGELVTGYLQHGSAGRTFHR